MLPAAGPFSLSPTPPTGALCYFLPCAFPAALLGGAGDFVGHSGGSSGHGGRARRATHRGRPPRLSRRRCRLAPALLPYLPFSPLPLSPIPLTGGRPRRRAVVAAGATTRAGVADPSGGCPSSVFFRRPSPSPSTGCLPPLLSPPSVDPPPCPHWPRWMGRGADAATATPGGARRGRPVGPRPPPPAPPSWVGRTRPRGHPRRPSRQPVGSPPTGGRPRHPGGPARCRGWRRRCPPPPLAGPPPLLAAAAAAAAAVVAGGIGERRPLRSCP